MREYEKFTTAINESGDLIIPIAMLKNWFGQDLQDLLNSHKFHTIGTECSEETYNAHMYTVEFNFPYSKTRLFSEKIQHANWYASKKFIEESIGLLHHYMERLNSSMYAVKNNHLKNKDELLKKMKKEKDRFENKNFPNMREELNKNFIDSIILENEVISLNKARNCFVHRRGIISKHDTNDNDNFNLIIKWYSYHIDEKNNPPITFINLEKKYGIGTTIIFDYKECTDTMFTLISYYNVLFDKCITSIGLNIEDAYYKL